MQVPRSRGLGCVSARIARGVYLLKIRNIAGDIAGCIGVCDILRDDGLLVSSMDSHCVCRFKDGEVLEHRGFSLE